MKRGASFWLSVALVVVCLSGAVFSRSQLELGTTILQARWTGIGALLALLISGLFRIARDLKLVDKAAQLRGRRHFGIAAAALASAHLVPVFGGYITTDRRYTVTDSIWLQCGVGAFTLLLALWLTSYPRLNKRLKIRNWQAIHLFVYPAGLLALLHGLQSPWSNTAFMLCLAAIWCASMLWRIGSSLLRP